MDNFDRASCSSLDSIIPCLPDYEAANHPFRTQLECDAQLERRRQKDQTLEKFYYYGVPNSVTNGINGKEESDSDSEELDIAPVSRNDTSNTLVRAVHRIMHKRGRKTEKDLKLLEAASELAKEKGLDLNRVTSLRSRHRDVLDKASLDGLKGQTIDPSELRSTVGNYFCATERLNSGENFHVAGRRVTTDGRVQYLIEWEGTAQSP